MADLKLPINLGPIALFRTGPAELLIRWLDGHEAKFPFRYLRDRCPCANCSKQAPAPAAAKPGMLPMMPVLAQGASGPADILELSAIGRYAVNFVFGDGHSSGIYSYEYLRQICPCESCSARRQEK